MKTIKYIGVCVCVLIVGIAIGYFLLPRKAPDVKITNDKIFIENKQLLTQVSELKTQLKQEIAKNINVTTVTHTEYRDNGTKISEDISSKLTDLTKINTDATSTSTTTLTQKGEIIYREKITEKIINYVGSAYLMWDIMIPMSYYPSTVGITYQFLAPLSLMVAYQINDKRVLCGISLQF